MAISSKRFSILDKETNLSISDFTNPGTSEIFNSPNLELKDMTKDMEAFLQQGKAAVELENPVPEEAGDLIRKAKDSYSSLKDVTKISQKDVDTVISDQLFNGNAGAASAYKQMAAACRTGPLKRMNSGKPFDPSIKCGDKSKKGKSGGCSVDKFSNVLDKLTNGAYKSEYQNWNQNLSNLVALATTGYNMNMCGVFSAVGQGMPPMVQSRGASMLLGSLGATKNLRGIFDLAKSTAGNSNFHVKQEIPNGIKGVFTKFKKPFDSTEKDYPQLNESINLSMEQFDDGWNVSDFDDMPSVSHVPDFSQDYDDILKGDVMQNSVDEDDLDFIPANPSILTRSGIFTKKFDLPGISI